MLTTKGIVMSSRTSRIAIAGFLVAFLATGCSTVPGSPNSSGAPGESGAAPGSSSIPSPSAQPAASPSVEPMASRSVAPTAPADPGSDPPVPIWAFQHEDSWYGGRQDGELRSLDLEGPREVRALGRSLIGIEQYGSGDQQFADLPRIVRIDPATFTTSVVKEFAGARYLDAIEALDGTIYSHWVTQSRDEGLIAIAPDGTVTTLVPAGPFPADGPQQPPDVGRAELAVSPDGTRVASGLCDMVSCQIDLVDMETGTVVRVDQGYRLLAVADDTVLLRDRDGQVVLLDPETKATTRLPFPREDGSDADSLAQIDAVLALVGDRFLVQRTTLGKVDIVLIADGVPTLVLRHEWTADRPYLHLITGIRPVGDLVWLSPDDHPTAGSALSKLDVRDGAVTDAGHLPSPDQ